MNEETKEKYENLRNMLMTRLNSEDVQTDNEQISLYGLVQLVENNFKKYNVLLVKKASMDVNRINKRVFRSNFIRGNYPFIISYYPTVTADGKIFITVTFCNEEGRCRGKAVIDENENITIENLDPQYKEEKALKLLKANSMSHTIFLHALNTFRTEYPGHDYTWFQDSTCPTGIQEVNDELVHCTINLSKPGEAVLGLSSIENIELARLHTKKYGTLYDYVDFYNASLMKKTGIKIDDLNPLYRDIVRKNLGLEKGQTREMRAE